MIVDKFSLKNSNFLHFKEQGFMLFLKGLKEILIIL